MSSAMDIDHQPEVVASTSSLLSACVRGFGSVLKHPLSSNHDFINSSVNLHDELGRLRLWAGSFGAHRKEKDRLSLDHRLREAPELHRLVRDHLSDISDAISHVDVILQDGGLESQPSGGRPPTPMSEDSDSDRSWADFDKQDPGFSELEEYLQDIRHAITSLYKFSVTLQNPATRDKTKKASRINLSHYVVYDIQHAAEKYGLPANSTLAQRLGRANTKRRQLLAYYKDHDERISKYIDTFIDGALRSEDSPVPKEKDQQDLARQHGSAFGYAPSTQSTQWTQNTTVSTVQMANLEVASDSGRTVFSTANSTVDNDGPTIPIPLPSDPEGAARQEPFICQICCQTITVANIDEDWRYHVYSDLRPYICTFDSCVQGNQLYDSYTEWSEHERQFHRREWVCYICSQISESRASFQAHVQSAHADLLSGDQLQAAIRASERPITTPQQCPLCTKPPVKDPARFQKHLARHLRQFSLFLLSRAESETPDGIEEDGSSSEQEETPSVRKSGTKPVEQIISNRYIVTEKLRHLLEERFGNNYNVTVSCGRYYLTLPERLSEEDIEACCD